MACQSRRGFGITRNPHKTAVSKGLTGIRALWQISQRWPAAGFDR
jgi:hypothetical protein